MKLLRALWLDTRFAARWLWDDLNRSPRIAVAVLFLWFVINWSV